MQLRTFSKNAVFLFAAQAFNAVTTLLFVPVLARYLGVADYGRYAYVYAFVGIFETLSVFGLHQILVREVAREHDRAPIYLGHVLGLKVPLSLGVFALIYLASRLFASSDLQLLIMICASEVLLRKFFLINVVLCRAFERMEYEFLITVVERTFALVGILLVVHYDWGITGVFLAFFSAAAVHALVGSLIVWRRLARPEFRSIQGLKRSLLSDSWPLGLSRETEVLYNRLATVLIGQWHPPRVVGAFSGGYRVYQIASLVIADSVSRSALPALSKLSQAPEKLVRSFRSIARLNVGVGVVSATSIWMLAPVAIPLLLGPEFRSSISVLRWTSLAMPFTFMNRLFSVALQATDRQRTDGFLTVGTLLVNLILNVALIPPFAALGSAWALGIAEALAFFAKGLVLTRSGSLRWRVRGEIQGQT
jgi:O-antigen/teichoic acid export membrane protein